MVIVGHYRSSGHGFTLIELLAVLGILALLMFALPFVLPSRVEALRVKDATRDMVSFVQRVRQESILSQREGQIAIDTGYGALTWGKHRERLKLPDTTMLGFAPAEGSWPTPDSATLHFYADGSSSGGTFSLQHKSTTYRVEVDWLTGHVSVAR